MGRVNLECGGHAAAIVHRWKSGSVAAALHIALLLVGCKNVVERHAVAALRDDLREMRVAIDTFHEEQHRYPASLSELKQMHYLRDIPIDPITRSRNWRVTTEKGVVIDVHSAAEKPYSDY